MPLIDLTAMPSKSMRRWFGLSFAILFAFLAFLFRSNGTLLPWCLAAMGIVVGATYYLLPSSQIPIIRLWQRITYPIAWTVSHILLASIFFGIVLPIGVTLRWFKHDPLCLRQNNGRTNWTPRAVEKNIARYFKQF